MTRAIGLGMLLILGGCKDDGPGASASGTGGTDTAGELPSLSVQFETVAWPGEPLFEITEMRFFPDSSQFLLLEKSGIVHHFDFDDGGGLVALGSFDLGITYDFNDCGLLSLAFDPDFADNGLMYVGACVDHDFSSVYRFTWNPDDYAAVVASQALIITEGDANAENPWHNVGSIGFFSDETMWVSFGDKTVEAHGQDPSTNLGTMLRIIPDRDPTGPGGYQPAPGNPFPQNPDVWSIGLRSPFRIVVDPLDRLIVGDVGAMTWEEVNLIDQPGLNFGWATAEGLCQQGCEGLTDPIVHWQHATNMYAAEDPDAVPVNRWVVWVGPHYDPPEGLDRYDGRLTGRLLYGDMCTGWIRALQIDDAGTVVYNEHAGHLSGAAAWDVGPDGFLYAVASADCVSAEFGSQPAVMVRTVLAVEEG